MESVRGRPRDADRRLERAHTVLDAAADAVLRWGYDKTTIDDIARAAGVPKGTIYLHWTTREALFVALVRRERTILLADVRDRLEAGQATFHGLLRELTLELTRRPLLQATVLGDSEVLGRLSQQRRGRAASGEVGAGFESYVRALLDHGALRADLSPPEQVSVVAAVFYGFHQVPELTLGAYRFADERLPDLLADTVTRALGADQPVSADDAEATSRATRDYLEHALEDAQEKLRRSLNIQEST